MIRLSIILTLALSIQATAANQRECENITSVLGFAAMSYDATTVLYFYASPSTSQSPVQVLRFFHDPKIHDLSFRVEGAKRFSLLRPEGHKLDYFLFELSVVERSQRWLKVLVDPQNTQTLWIQESRNVR